MLRIIAILGKFFCCNTEILFFYSLLFRLYVFHVKFLCSDNGADNNPHKISQLDRIEIRIQKAVDPKTDEPRQKTKKHRAYIMIFNQM